MNKIECPKCHKQVQELAPACPNCGEKIYVEHPGDIKGVRHSQLDMPPASKTTYGPKKTD